MTDFFTTLYRRIGPRGAVAALVLLVVIAGFAARAMISPGAQTSAQAGRWVELVAQPLETQLGLVGQIQAATRITLTAPFEGVVREVRVQEGQRVERGQTLLTLDTAQLAIQMRQAEAEGLKVQREVQQLRQWENSTEVARARRALAHARQALSQTHASLRDTQALFARGIVARMEVDALVQQVNTQTQEVSSAQEELAAVLARGQGEARKIAEMELLNAQARYQALEAMHAQREVTAPVAGVIVRSTAPQTGKAMMVQAGLSVTQGTPLLTVIGQDRFEVLTRVEETDLHLLQEGMAVQISGDGFAGHMLDGHIATIALQTGAMQTGAAEGQGSGAYYDVVVAIDSPLAVLNPPVRLGMSARLAVILYRNAYGIALAPEAIQRDEQGQSYVQYRATPAAPVVTVPVTAGQPVLQGVEVQGLERVAGLVTPDGAPASQHSAQGSPGDEAPRRAAGNNPALNNAGPLSLGYVWVPSR
ncbi:HlyD family secretion protein [Dickeya lacustris]|uniref:HlyD family efflux transporter periplasmic adaptor subunit n=1 Tax=Dickeya lacustris TaxID=2259638 RepID=A0ABY8G2L1_9GAMM|nr:HlyD family efflux transporter periplasmic adaptor subunit [Dickeya lacustris]WFN54184.1 HlyD family efflux transporter periplasmic adaptor subunit [Dickeya lacustris]